MHLPPPCLHALPLCTHAGGCRRDSMPTPSPLHLSYANPIPQFMHPNLPCTHAFPLCHRRDSAPASPLCHAMQTTPPSLCPPPAHTPTHTPTPPSTSTPTPPPPPPP